jgi:arylsulfatase A-like enzyme
LKSWPSEAWEISHYAPREHFEELYDLEADPEELTNLTLVPEHRATLEDFRARLESELKRTDAGLLKNLPKPRIK